MPIHLVRKNGQITPMKNAEYLMAYYMIPKEILRTCGRELNSIPRYPHLAVRDWKSIAVIESDLFLNLIMDTYAYMVWPYLGVKGYMENYSGYDPLWRLAHCPIIWLEAMMKDGYLLSTERFLKETAHDDCYEFLSLNDFEDIMEEIVPTALEDNGLYPVINAIVANRCPEDYDARASHEKTDFFRRWYHLRAQHQTISYEGWKQDFYDSHGGDKYDIEDTSVDVEEKALSKDMTRQFMGTLGVKDRKILELRLEGKTLEEIADKLGYSNHSGVQKRIRRIGQAYERFAGIDLGFNEKKIM